MNPTVFVRTAVLRRLLQEARRRSAVHLGVLLGIAGREDDEPVVELIGVSELTYTARLETSYRPMRDALERTRDALEADGAEEDGRIAGMAAVFEGSGGELTEEVVRLHLSLFNGPGQVALVGDPETAEFGLYVRPEGGSFENIPLEIDDRVHRETERR